jgi:DNA-3-methyladenine glycosylase II
MNYSAAVRHLKRADPVLRRTIERVGPCRLGREQDRERFGALADAIIYQQLALNAAQTISRRFWALFSAGDGERKAKYPSPEEILSAPRRKLRAAGLSRQKMGYIRDLALKAADGSLRLETLDGVPDEEVILTLTQVKGIGRWTAEMFLIFSLARPDVLPVGDLGLQHAIRLAYRLRKLPSARKIVAIAEPWRPYRSVATWFLWKSRRTTAP